MQPGQIESHNINKSSESDLHLGSLAIEMEHNLKYLGVIIDDSLCFKDDVAEIKQKLTLGSLDLPSMLEPRGLYRTDGEHPDGVSMNPWEMGKQLVWDVTVVDALAPSRLNQGSLCNPGTTATEAEACKIEKYRELIDNGYIFRPGALKIQGFLARAVKFSSRVSVKCSVFRTTINELAAF